MLAANGDVPFIVESACEVCHTTENITLCADCQTVYYCGWDHKRADLRTHFPICMEIEAARAKVISEEYALKTYPSADGAIAMLDPNNPFETMVGYFWGTARARSYLRARTELLDLLRKNYGLVWARSHVVLDVLGQLEDMLRLDRSDSQGTYLNIPALYVRLHRDQDAYNFIKWHCDTWDAWEATGIDWGDLEPPPFVNTQSVDLDLFEPVDEAWSKVKDHRLSHFFVLLLLKVRLLLSLRAAQEVRRCLRSVLPPEIIELIQRHVGHGGVLKSRPDAIRGGIEKTMATIEATKNDIRKLYRAIESSNETFWGWVLYKGDNKDQHQRAKYTLGEEGETWAVLRWNYPAWLETPMAIETIKAVRASERGGPELA